MTVHFSIIRQELFMRPRGPHYVCEEYSKEDAVAALVRDAQMLLEIADCYLELSTKLEADEPITELKYHTVVWNTNNSVNILIVDVETTKSNEYSWRITTD